MNFAHFCEFWCFSLTKQAQFTLNSLRKVHELTFLWFGLPGPLLTKGSVYLTKAQVFFTFSGSWWLTVSWLDAFQLRLKFSLVFFLLTVEIQFQKNLSSSLKSAASNPLPDKIGSYCAQTLKNALLRAARLQKRHCHRKCFLQCGKWHENGKQDLSRRLSCDRQQDLCDRERPCLEMCFAMLCLFLLDFRACNHGLKWETDFYTPPVLGGAALLPFSAPAVYKNPVP